MMKIAFCTCVQIGKSCIEAILSAGGQFNLLLTLHDHKSQKKSGRVYLDDIANVTGIPLYKLNHINDADVAEAATTATEAEAAYEALVAEVAELAVTATEAEAA